MDFFSAGWLTKHVMPKQPYYIQTKDSDEHLTFADIVPRQDYFDRTSPFTYVMVLRKTHLWNKDNATRKEINATRKQIMQLHKVS